MDIYFAELAAGLSVVLLTTLAAWAWRRAQKTGQLARVHRALAEQWSYVRKGFRWTAVLDCDFDTHIARAYVCKSEPSPPSPGGKVARLRTLTSRCFQSRRSFAEQVYATWVPFCTTHGWGPLEIHGWTPPDLRGFPQQTWPVEFRTVESQVYLLLRPGWTPISQADDEREQKQTPLKLPATYLPS